MNLRFGEMQENIPHSWEEEGLNKNPIEIGFRNLGNETFGFTSAKDISDKVVVIDPVPNRMWSSYYGGDSTDYVSEIVTDKLGNVCITGNTFSTTNIATAGGFITSVYMPSNLDSYVMKMDSNGFKLWGTYTNGSVADINIDSYNNVISTGNVYFLSHIGTPGTHKPNHNNYNHDAYILKLNPNGIREWGTFYGGPGEEYIYGSSIDINDNVIIVGYTESSTEIASASAHQQNRSGYSKDGFIAKINTFGQRVWGTYYGGSGEDILKDCALDEAGNIYIIGETSSNDNMIFGIPYKALKDGPIDAVLALFSQSGDIIFGTYYGGENNEYFTKIDYADQKVIISGNSNSTTKLSTPNAPYPTPVVGSNSLGSIFSLFDKNGQLLMGSYFYNKITDCGFDFDGNILIAGSTTTDGLATPNSFQPLRYNYSEDAFAIKYDVNNYSKIWGTYFGGDSFEVETALHVDKILKNIYLGGRTYSSINIASPNAYQKNKYNTWEDGYVVKFNYCQNNVSASANSNICPGSEIKLLATGGTSYSWTGPNGFTSSLPNPIITNASSIHDGIYICAISGTGDCDGSYSVTVKVEDITAPIPNVTNLPTITGNCKTVITTFPTAFDNCTGNIVGTTADPMQYSLPGNYVIHWIYKDGNGNSSTQDQNVIITSEPLPTANSVQDFCLIDNPKISTIQITGTSVKWYDAAGTLLNRNTPLVNGTKYFATQTLNGCESAQKEILVNVNDPNAPTGNATQDFCSAQNPTISNIILIEQNVKWYNGIGTLLPRTTPLVDGETYYSTQTVNGCESTQKTAVTVSITNGGIPAIDFPWSFCNDTIGNTKTDNLNNYKGNLITNSTNYIFEFFDANNQVIPNPANVNLNIGSNLFNVKISNSLGCFNFVKLNLTLNPKPILNLPLNKEFCNGQTVTLDAGSGFDSYEWTKDDSPTVISKKQILVVSEAGKYSIKVKNSFCENTASVNVTQSVIANIVGIQIINNTAAVQMSAAGDFEYSLDNITWQNLNIFKNLSNGNFTVFVKTKSGCIIGSMNFSIFSIPNAFSPDADGINDTWKIDGIENYPNSEIQVFDRFGTLVFQKITNGTFEWDGFSNSRVLPTGNYWYVIKVSDGRLLNGWVLIKNRN
ncbi:T9SS type B sorting domain-containing protein [Kaistella flava (ex Peng et al. 2021)]|uniref:T9SS type B sorting domain-containing protein n=1 Tax=Kaistella flava (ex Peng et al. 2021) TaxID=2038776 RepID=A0A7M2Y5T7_9FLAO|nr:T9SS type B sorting domain-containing protein [Kaistella flava (ex Peng et al. 2021)]QOW09607.1 T9SS type B sorting domain-containing protein [Kaistella flava (ex Peng et al. 2021)]